jgi:hypothetical protein
MILPIRILLIHKIFPILGRITQLLLSFKSQPNFNYSHPQDAKSNTSISIFNMTLNNTSSPCFDTNSSTNPQLEIARDWFK